MLGGGQRTRNGKLKFLTYSAARELVSKLTGEDVRGLCIITNESAQRIAEEKTRDKTSTEESVTSAK